MHNILVTGAAGFIGFYNILEACRHSYDGGANGVIAMVFRELPHLHGAFHGVTTGCHVVAEGAT